MGLDQRIIAFKKRNDVPKHSPFRLKRAFDDICELRSVWYLNEKLEELADRSLNETWYEITLEVWQYLHHWITNDPEIKKSCYHCGSKYKRKLDAYQINELREILGKINNEFAKGKFVFYYASY